MNITIITPAFPYPKRGILGGIERFVENLATYLQKMKFKVKIVTTYWNGGKRYDNYKGIPILRVKDSKVLFGKIGSIFMLNSFTFGLNVIRKKNFRFYFNSDIIILPFVLGFSRFFKYKKIPVISIFHHYDIPRSFNEFLTLPFHHYLEKRQFRKHRCIVVHSESTKNEIIKYYRINEEFIRLIIDGINLEIFNPNNYDPQIRAKFGDNILLYLGEFYRRKKVPILLKAMKYVIKVIPDVQLVLIGEGDKRMLNYCKKLSRLYEIQQNLTFLGFVKDELAIKYYATCDIFVFPSELEGFGLVILEAMASGTPVICADKLPMSKLVGNGGVTFKLNDPRDLSRKIIELLKNRELLSKLKRKSMKIVKKYDWLNIVSIYIKYFSEIIKKQ